MKKMIMSEGWGKEREEKKKRERTILKSEPKPDDRGEKKKMMMMKNMVQIHDEQRSIQMTILHRDTHNKHCSDKHCDYK